MRAFTPIAIALALILLPQALAGPDREGDGYATLPFGSTLDLVVDCESPAADITYLWAYADSEAIRAGLSIADIEDRAITCSHLGGWTGTQGETATYEVILYSPGEGDALGLTGTYLEVGFFTLATPDGTLNCVEIRSESWVSPCLGESSRYGSNLTWSAPLQGSFLLEDGSVRSYDLAGRQFFGGAGASVRSGYPGIAVRDTATLDQVQS